MKNGMHAIFEEMHHMFFWLEMFFFLVFFGTLSPDFPSKFRPPIFLFSLKVLTLLLDLQVMVVCVELSPSLTHIHPKGETQYHPYLPLSFEKGELIQISL